jgi:IclR family transcriptional regulator, acetate operon repressor
MNESVRKATEVLLALSEVERHLSARELAELIDVPKSTAQRLLQALEPSGLVRQDLATRRYGLGPRTLTLGMAFLERVDVRAEARPHMHRLHEELDETIELSIRAGASRIYVEQIEARSELKAKAELGRLYPLWAGAAGRVLLAAMPRDELRRFTAEAGASAFTHVEPPTMAGLVAQLETESGRGYAMAFDETIRGVHTIATPVRIGPSEVAALSVSGPSSRFDEHLMRSAAGPLMAAAAAIDAAMGFATPAPDGEQVHTG